MNITHRSFGECKSNVTYKDRKGAYVVVLDGCGNVALVETPTTRSVERNLFLPGGGIEVGETLEECILRECLEEIGYSVDIGDCFCIGDEYLFAPSEENYLHVIGHCYYARLGKWVQTPKEKDYTLIWIPIAKCDLMFLKYQAWAVKLAWNKKENIL